MLCHDCFVPSDSRSGLGFAWREFVHLVCRLVDERKHRREGNIVLCKQFGSNAVEAVHEVAAEDGSQVKILPSLTIHLLRFATHALGKQMKQLEVLRLTCLHIKGNT